MIDTGFANNFIQGYEYDTIDSYDFQEKNFYKI